MNQSKKTIICTMLAGALLHHNFPISYADKLYRSFSHPPDSGVRRMPDRVGDM